MYTILCDDNILYDTLYSNEDLSLIELVIKKELNKFGSFSFKIPPNHRYYDSIKKLKSVIKVINNDNIIFQGRIIDEDTDFFNRKSINCEGELSYLNDTIVRAIQYDNISIVDYFTYLINQHNNQVTEDKQFQIGNITVNDTISVSEKYVTTWSLINKLISKYSGYVQVRYTNDIKYIDYLLKLDNVSSQIIEFGENLLDFTKNIDTSSIATALIPLGKDNLTIADINNGVDYITSSTVDTYGFILTTKNFNNVTDSQTLLSIGQEYLSTINFESITLECTALDLHNLDVDIQSINLGDRVKVLSKPHNLDSYFLVTTITIYPLSPDKDRLTLGISNIKKFTDTTASIQEDKVNQVQVSDIVSTAISDFVVSDTFTEAVQDISGSSSNKNLIHLEVGCNSSGNISKLYFYYSDGTSSIYSCSYNSNGQLSQYGSTSIGWHTE